MSTSSVTVVRVGHLPKRHNRLYEWLRPLQCGAELDGDVIVYWYHRTWRWAR